MFSDPLTSQNIFIFYLGEDYTLYILQSFSEGLNNKENSILLAWEENHVCDKNTQGTTRHQKLWVVAHY